MAIENDTLTETNGTTARSNCRLTVKIACDRLETLIIRVHAVVRLIAPSFKQSNIEHTVQKK